MSALACYKSLKYHAWQVFPTAAVYKPGDVDSTTGLRIVLQPDYVFAAMFM